MRFCYAQTDAYEDVGGGRVLYSARGFPGFPPRLAVELFERARQLTGLDRVGLWDPMCGAGGMVTTVALLRHDNLTRILASDVNEAALELAAKNLSLTSAKGLVARRAELLDRSAELERVRSADRLIAMTAGATPPSTAVARADATDARSVAALDLHGIHLVMADLPYGQQTTWGGAPSSAPARCVLETLSGVLRPGTTIVLITTERDVFRPLPAAARSFKHGRRHIRMYRVA